MQRHTYILVYIFNMSYSMEGLNLTNDTKTSQHLILNDANNEHALVHDNIQFVSMRTIHVNLSMCSFKIKDIPIYLK